MYRSAELRALALLALALSAIPVHALPDDRLQAIEISAERALRDEKAGYTVYTGAVILQQGSLHIEADKLTVFHDRESASRIVAVGKPARLRQQPEPDKGFVTASAGRIVYEATREHVLLRQSASIEQEGAVVSGESIDYFLAEQRVRADADAQDGNARVQVLIPAAVVEAETLREETATDGAARDGAPSTELAPGQSSTPPPPAPGAGQGDAPSSAAGGTPASSASKQKDSADRGYPGSA